MGMRGDRILGGIKKIARGCRKSFVPYAGTDSLVRVYVWIFIEYRTKVPAAFALIFKAHLYRNKQLAALLRRDA